VIVCDRLAANDIQRKVENDAPEKEEEESEEVCESDGDQKETVETIKDEL